VFPVAEYDIRSGLAPAVNRPVQPSGTPLRQRTYAALDLGTNNCRLLVARPSVNGFRVVDAFSRIVRLGEGLVSTGELSRPAMRRAIDALRICSDKLRERGNIRHRLIATEACRAARNGTAFLAEVKEETGLDLEVVDRATEAELAAAGCAVLADPTARSVILFDIGGGSTEIVWLRSGQGSIRQRIKAWDSLPVGVVTLAERHGGEDVDERLFEAMVDEVRVLLAPFERRAGAAARDTRFHLLGTSGTVTTMAGLYLGLDRYDRRRVDGLWMRAEDTTGVIQALLRMSYRERARNGCIGTDRADLVLAGCAIFEAIRRAFPSDRIRIADRGLREGILMEMMQQDGVMTPGRSGGFR
jgi:exopolyphosphatase/guanosine-5'-triphosphate,3'-diphosphate pyrophosphatase